MFVAPKSITRASACEFIETAIERRRFKRQTKHRSWEKFPRIMRLQATFEILQKGT